MGLFRTGTRTRTRESITHRDGVVVHLVLEEVGQVVSVQGQQAAVGVKTKEGAEEGDGGGLGQLVVVHMV